MKLPPTRAIRLMVLVGLLHIALERETLAYLDPGSASYALQMVIAAVVAAGFAIRTYWAKLKSFFGGSALQSEQREQASDESSSGGVSSS